jgi:hypothetical protein
VRTVDFSDLWVRFFLGKRSRGFDLKEGIVMGTSFTSDESKPFSGYSQAMRKVTIERRLSGSIAFGFLCFAGGASRGFAIF